MHVSESSRPIRCERLSPSKAVWKGQAYCCLRFWDDGARLWRWLVFILLIVDKSEVHKILAVELNRLENLIICWLLDLSDSCGSSLSAVAVNIVDPNDPFHLVPTTESARVAVSHSVSIWVRDRIAKLLIPALRSGHNADLTSGGTVSWMIRVQSYATRDSDVAATD